MLYLNNFNEFLNIERPSNRREFIITFKCPECGEEAKSNFLLLERFGEDRFYCFKCLRKHTSIKKYGVDNAAKSKDIQMQIANTKKERYGDGWAKKWYKKQSCTIKDKYGVSNIGELDNHYEKCKNTRIKNFGSLENSYKESYKKTKETLIEKFGSLEYANKVRYETTKKAVKKKYGVDNISQSELWKNKHLEKTISNLMKTNSSDRYFYKSANGYYLHCNLCNSDFLEKNNDIIYRCPDCFPIRENASTSYAEKEIFSYIKSIYNGNIISRKKSILPNHKKEIDIYLPDLKLGIEFDGIYWHSTDSISDRRSYNKMNEANSVGIRIIDIWENEWCNKRPIVESIIKNFLGIRNDNIYMARKCTIKEISNKDCIHFCNDNHLQGGLNSSVNLGLFYNNELIQIMCFNKSRYTNRYEWEMMRECSKINTTVIGGKGKLLKYFENNFNPKSLVSYCDKRYFLGSSYIKLGFSKVRESKPSFWVVDRNNNVRNRMEFTKPKMKKIKNFKFNENLSQIENCLMNNYRFLVDCGQLVFVKYYN